MPLWLLSATAAPIASPLVIHTFNALKPTVPLASGGSTMAARADASQANRHQAASAAATPAQREPSASDQALVAAFSALPSPFTGPFTGDPVPAAGRGEALPAANDSWEPETGPAAAGFRGGGADLLGGPLSLADLVDTPQWPFDRPAPSDPRLQADTADPLASRWSEHLQALVKHTPLVLPVEVVRVRSGAVDRAQAIPMALWPDGSATTNVATPNPSSQQLAHEWVRKQPPLMEGSVRPVLMVIEPEVAQKAAPTVVPTATTPPPAELSSPSQEPVGETAATAVAAHPEPTSAAGAPAEGAPAPVP